MLVQENIIGDISVSQSDILFLNSNVELKIDNIMKGYEYLRNMNKEDLQISYFIKQLYTIIFNTIHKKI